MIADCGVRIADFKCQIKFGNLQSAIRTPQSAIGMICETVTVGNKLGLHARAAARFVQIAAQFKSQITLSRPEDGQTADGKSILEILMLAAREGTKLRVTISGEDEQRAWESIFDLIRNKFGEK